MNLPLFSSKLYSYKQNFVSYQWYFLNYVSNIQISETFRNSQFPNVLSHTSTNLKIFISALAPNNVLVEKLHLRWPHSC